MCIHTLYMHAKLVKCSNIHGIQKWLTLCLPVLFQTLDVPGLNIPFLLIFDIPLKGYIKFLNTFTHSKKKKRPGRFFWALLLGTSPTGFLGAFLGTGRFFWALFKLKAPKTSAPKKCLVFKCGIFSGRFSGFFVSK